MTDDQILQIARECGYDSGETVEMNDVGLITFAHRIAELEREACAKVCDGMYGAGGMHIAEQIRSRK